MHNVVKIFDQKLFKAKIKYSHPNVLKLQNLLTETLQQRMELFSRNFSVKVVHGFNGCNIQENPVDVDPELLPFKNHSIDLAISSGPLMFTNDVPGVLKQWYAALKPGGVFMGAFFGEDTLKELKDSFLNAEEHLQLPHCLRFSPTIATKDSGMLMQRAGFHLPTADRTRHVFKVDSLQKLLDTLKAMGGNLLYKRSKNPLSKEFLKVVEGEYFKRYSCDGKLVVTIDIVCMTGWAIERYADERIQQNTQKNIGYL